MVLKNILKEVRQKKKLTQEELGDSVGVSRQTIISIETYRYKPTLELAMKLSMKLNCKIDKLFYFEKDWLINNCQITVRIIYIVEEKTASIVRKKGGRPDSNRRPPEPQSGVLTNWTTTTILNQQI